MQRRDEVDTVSQLKSLLAAERAENAQLQRDLNLRNSALDSATSHFMILDVRQRRWTIVYANRAIAQDHGYETTELLGQSPTLLVPIEENEVALERIQGAVQNRQSVRTELI